MNQIKARIEQFSSDFHNEIIGIRNHFHQNPELSCEEFQTAEFICRKLDEYGIPYRSGIAETGVDLISSGAITHSAPCLDLGLDLIEAAPND